MQYKECHHSIITIEARKKQSKRELVFPKIPKDYKPSARVMAMTLGKLPEGVDLEKELEERWQEWAK